MQSLSIGQAGFLQSCCPPRLIHVKDPDVAPGDGDGIGQLVQQAIGGAVVGVGVLAIGVKVGVRVATGVRVGVRVAIGVAVGFCVGVAGSSISHVMLEIWLWISSFLGQAFEVCAQENFRSIASVDLLSVNVWLS